MQEKLSEVEFGVEGGVDVVEELDGLQAVAAVGEEVVGGVLYWGVEELVVEVGEGVLGGCGEGLVCGGGVGFGELVGVDFAVLVGG